MTGTNKVNTLLNEIVSASQEQSDGIVEVNKGVSEMDKVTQQNAGNAEELASAAEETAAQVGVLREQVAKFTGKDDNDSPASAHATHTHTSAPAQTSTRKVAEPAIPMGGKDDGFESF